MQPKTVEERLARTEAMLCALVDRYNGQLVKGNQEMLNEAASEIRQEIEAHSGS